MSNTYPPNPQDPSGPGQGGYEQQGFNQQGFNGQGHGQQSYGERPYGQGQGAGFEAPRPYASWGQRVAARLIDSLIMLPFLILFIPGMIVAMSDVHTTRYADGTTTSTGNVNPVGVLLALGAFVVLFAFEFWNMVWRQGKTGQSLGKKAMNITVVAERTGQPQGVGMTFVRYLAHYLDSLPCDLGYLWPLWDAKRQTFADKIMNTVVVETPKH